MPRRKGQSELPLQPSHVDEWFDRCPYCQETYLRSDDRQQGYFTHLNVCEKYNREAALQAHRDSQTCGRGNKRHGTQSRYKAGCRCESCREAHRKDSVRYRLKRITRSADPENHG